MKSANSSNSLAPTTTTTKATTTTAKPTTTIKPTTTTVKATTTTSQPTTTKPKATTTTAKTTAATVSSSDREEGNSTDTSASSEESDDGAKNPTVMASLRVCPGVCVASRISEYCEAVLNVEGLCKTSMKCCVTKSLFGDSDHPPELVRSFLSSAFTILLFLQIDG